MFNQIVPMPQLRPPASGDERWAVRAGSLWAMTTTEKVKSRPNPEASEGGLGFVGRAGAAQTTFLRREAEQFPVPGLALGGPADSKLESAHAPRFHPR